MEREFGLVGKEIELIFEDSDNHFSKRIAILKEKDSNFITILNPDGLIEILPNERIVRIKEVGK